MRNISGLTLICCGALLLFAASAFAHCEGLDGPVVQAAERALATGKVNAVLIWVQKADEPEIGKAFKNAQAVRKLGAEAREPADRHFFETLVRVHRAGEGAGFTGLKPAGRNLGPAIPAADKALRDHDPEPLLKLPRDTVQKNAREHFEKALAKQKFAENDVEAGWQFVRAYVEYIHYVETPYATATKQVEGHYNDGDASASQKEHHDHDQ